MVDVMIWNPVERFLWGVAITLLLICGLIYVYRGTQREDRTERLILFGYSSLFFGWALHRVGIFLLEIQLEGIYVQNDFYGIFDINNINFQIFQFWSLLFAYVGYFLFFFAVEMSLNRTKFLISIFFATIIISYIIFWFIFPFELLWNVVVSIIALFFLHLQ